MHTPLMKGQAALMNDVQGRAYKNILAFVVDCLLYKYTSVEGPTTRESGLECSLLWFSVIS